MPLFDSRERTSHTLRALAWLLGYPDAGLRGHLAELQGALHAERALGPGRLAELDRLMARLRSAPGLQAEQAYVELFDRGRGTALHLFEHVHGDSRERGGAMVALLRSYEEAGLILAPGELPDYLPVLLEYASTQPAAQARACLREFAHILQRLLAALVQRESAYASVMGALLDLAGEAAQPVTLPDEPGLDESWEEPAVFGGCSTQGQAGPAQAQTIRIVKNPASAPGARP